MGKNSGKSKKAELGYSFSDNQVKQNKSGNNSPKAEDKDTAIFFSMSQELKEEGNKLFQKRDLEGAMLKYEKAIKLLPRNHIDVSYLRSNIATCYMQMGISEYPRAIHECNLALEVTPKYGKALLKRARCYEALNRLDLALRDVNAVLKMEPNNVMAIEVSERVTKALGEKGLKVTDTTIELPPDYVEPPIASPIPKEKPRRRKSKKMQQEKKPREEIEEKAVDDGEIQDKKAEDKLVVEEKISYPKEEQKKTIKVVFEEEIRWVQVPVNCSLSQLRDAVFERFESLGDFLIKYRDQEGDLVTIRTDDELKWAEAAVGNQGSLRLYLFEKPMEVFKPNGEKHFPLGNGNLEKPQLKESKLPRVDEWIVEFAKMFKDHVGLDSDAYLGLHELGMKVYSEAMEETVTSEEAQGLFDRAAATFQEMSALALFNWGNVHMSRAKKKVHLAQDASRESVLQHIKAAYDWAQKEYSLARRRYEESLRIKPDFYEGFLALGQQQFEQARLIWYYTIGSGCDLETWPSDEVIQLYNCAEDNMERGMRIWEELEERRQSELSGVKSKSHKTDLDEVFEDMSAEEANEQAKNMKSQINVLWGTMLYERSVMEFKLGIPVWQECLEVAIEKFVLAGASPTDVAVMIKNHISNDNALEGLGFRIDEIVQAWNEMHEAKKLQSRVPSFRLEPLLRRRVSKIYHALEIA